MISNSKTIYIKQPILNHNTFNFNQTTIYSKQEILQQNLEFVTMLHSHSNLLTHIQFENFKLASLTWTLADAH